MITLLIRTWMEEGEGKREKWEEKGRRGGPLDRYFLSSSEQFHERGGGGRKKEARKRKKGRSIQIGTAFPFGTSNETALLGKKEKEERKKRGKGGEGGGGHHLHWRFVRVPTGQGGERGGGGRRGRRGLGRGKKKVRN